VRHGRFERDDSRGRCWAQLRRRAGRVRELERRCEHVRWQPGRQFGGRLRREFIEYVERRIEHGLEW
jgi:hypothetical protein